MRTFLLTGLALVAFAANSVLCRLALGRESIDPASFTTVRLGSGALTLFIISRFRGAKLRPNRDNWISPVMLFLYAIAFSFAYVNLSAGTGALILFGSVQATMILSALRSGERPHRLEWTGLLLALSGLVYLVFPGLAAPSFTGSLLMATAGVGWGIYTLRGRNAADPLAATALNFARTVPLVLGASVLGFSRIQISGTGILWAVMSGALASALGYVVWYAALKGLTATHAATVQLAVPILAALGGVVFLSETISLRLLFSSFLILGGIGLAVAGRNDLFRRKVAEL